MSDFPGGDPAPTVPPTGLTSQDVDLHGLTSHGLTSHGLDLRGLTLRDATEADLPVIIALLADDKLGSARETPDDLAPYLAAFAEVEADPHQRLIVAERDGAVVGTFQLTVIPGVSQRGLKRALIESVRVTAGERGSGLGTAMMTWAVAEARSAGCGMVQLTSNAERPAAHRFYERLGFVPSHVGFKLKLS